MLSFEHLRKYQKLIIKRYQAYLYTLVIIIQTISWCWLLFLTLTSPSLPSIDLTLFYGHSLVTVVLISYSANFVKLYVTKTDSSGLKSSQTPTIISLVASIIILILMSVNLFS
ncbi:MAG: hypothetical protein ACXAC6_01015 [Candidatus Hodarchaeales archaeon]